MKRNKPALIATNNVDLAVELHGTGTAVYQEITVGQTQTSLHFQ